MSVQSEIEACKRKKRYGSEQAAKDAARAEMAEPFVPDLYPYKCPRPKCGGWHITKNRQ